MIDPPSHNAADSLESAPSQRGFWLTTFLFAMPFGLVTTLAGTVITMQIAVAQSSETANLSDYNAAFWSSILIGLLVFFGFCYLIVPIAMVVLGLLRLGFRAVIARRVAKHVLFSRQLGRRNLVEVRVERR